MENSEINILLVEDNPADAILVSEMLDGSDLRYRLTHASMLGEAVKFLSNERFDVTLLDLGLPDSSGLSGLETLLRAGPGMPVILLTGTDDEDLGIRAVHKNASDYLVKGQIKSYGLVRSLRYAIERKRGQMEREITIEFLRMVNESSSLHALVKTVATFFQKQAGCQAVGIRLNKNNDYPYSESRGFPKEFLREENSLCDRDSSGNPVLGENGCPHLRCICGDVICGRSDPSKPYFTSHGSFWTNSTTQHIADSAAGARPDFARSRCNIEGFESVALIPLRFGNDRLGLLQLNDRKRGLFSPELISLWERLADHFAVALSKLRTEEELRENDERYRSLVEMSPEAIFVNCGNKITYANKAALNLFGASSPEELLGKTPFDLYHPDYHPLMRYRINLLTEGHSVPLVETKAIRLDGRIIDVEVVASSYLEKGVRSIQVLVRDITERKHAVEMLALEKRNLQLIFNVVNVGMLLIDEKGAVKRVNNMLSRWLDKDPVSYCGVQPGDLLGCVHALSNPGGCGQSEHCAACPVRNTFETVLKTGQPVHNVETKTFISVGGNEKSLWIELNADPLEIDGMRHVIIAMTDITDRKKMQEVVERYHLISLYARDPLLLTGMDGRIIEGNEAAVSFYGHTHEELLKLDIGRLQMREDAETAGQRFGQARAGGVLYETEHVRKDGTIIPVEVSACVVTIENREMLLSVVRDITERRKREMELKALNRTLKAQSLSDQAMMRARDESEYMNEVCGIVVKACGHAMVWIGLAENDNEKSVRPVASAGFDEGYLEKLKITWADTERGRGPTGTAVRTGEPCMCRNMLTDPAFKPWRNDAIRRGYASSVVFPLKTEGKPFGAISIYSRDPDPFSEDEVCLLSELADDLAYGITAIRLRAALRKSEQDANAILNAITESIILLDTSGRILAANSIAAERLGIRASEIGGRNYFDLLPAIVSEPRRIHAEKVLNSGREVRFEDERDGMHYAHNLYPVRDGMGNISGLAIFSSDITSRKWMEDRLAHQRAMFEAVIESSDGPVFSVDSKYCYTIFNSQHMNLMKSAFDADIKPGGSALDCVSNQETAAQMRKNLDLALNGNLVTVEDYVGRDVATRRYFGISYNPIREMDSTVSGVAVFAKDLTERKQMEDALRISEERYRALFNGMTEGFALHEIINDDNGNPCDCLFLDINPAFEKLTGLKREDVLYRKYSQVMPENEPYWFENLSKVAVTGKPAQLENYSSSLKRYYQMYAFSPAPKQFAIVFMDITERKKAEEILKRDRKTLRKLVREGAERLMEIQVELERAKRLSDIGELAATVAHELRNPLAGINLATAVIKKKTTDQMVSQQLQGIEKMIDESSQIIDNLLFYSRLKPPHRKPVDLHIFIEECTSAIRHVYARKGIEISKSVESLKDSEISADPVQIREVLNNVLNNAADAVPEQGGKITINARYYPGLVKIYVSDNGQGIDKEHLKKVFDPFFTTKARGTGLGLTVCRQIVEMHGGTIIMKSVKDKGTTVVITLPREKEGKF